MSRRHLTFPCGTDTLVGTLDEGKRTTGLLLVSGGSEIRSGAFSGHAQLAARLAAAGHPVFRFDRRGIGDSTGSDPGFRGSGPDIAAALDAFRREAPHVTRVVGFGNCDAASALALAGGAGCDMLVLANPWTFDSEDDGPPPEAIRSRYVAKLKNPHELMRLAKGQVSIRKLVGGLAKAARPAAARSTLSQEIERGLSGYDRPIRFLVAMRDRTGQAFLSSWNAEDTRIRRCEGANHAFGEPHARDWLRDELLDALSE